MNRRRSEAGQGMVEFALILPLLLMLMLGVIEFGRMLTIYNGVSNASREAARYGSVVGDSNATQAGTQYHFLDCAGMRAAARRTAVLTTLSDSDIVIEYERSNDSGGFDSLGACVQDTQPGASIQNGYRVVVTVSTTYAPIVPLVPIPSNTFTFTAARTIFPNIVSIQCSDGEDNDSDGQTDYPDDPGCATAADTDETTTNSSATCYPLTIAIAPAGAGIATTNPASDPDCPGGQFSDFVVVTAAPATGYRFVNYTGDASGTNPAITLSMSSAKNVTANFGPICYSLAASVSPADSGTVVVSTAPNCDDNSDGTHDSFTSGYTITVEAVPACERAFSAWTGTVDTLANLTASPTTLVLDDNKTIIANFNTTVSYTFDYGVTDGDFSGASDGTASATSNDCPGGRYTQGKTITVFASPLPSYEFDEWTSDTSGSNFVSADNP
jgi:Flp pilus assembly protein TadG